MCTLSWVRSGADYTLLMNRDERRTRGPEAPPAVRTAGDVRFLAPADGDFGGTWVAVNEHGVSFALLNAYSHEPAPREHFVSRGELIPSLAGHRVGETAVAALATFELSTFRPFRLVAVDPTGAIEALWTGRSLEVAQDVNGDVPLVSSGVDEPRVTAARRARFGSLEDESGGSSPEVLARFHRDHADGPSEVSTCMHRADAETRSLTRIDVGDATVRCTYVAGPPCAGASPVELTLERSRRSESAPSSREARRKTPVR